MAIPGSWFGFFGNLYSVYARGQAWLVSGAGDRAADEFQKILNQPGIVGSDPVGARTTYQDFLARCKDADPGIPILEQAKAEYASLR